VKGVAQFLENTRAVVWKVYFAGAACELPANARKLSCVAVAGTTDGHYVTILFSRAPEVYQGRSRQWTRRQESA
jgi:hypothetical protein